MNKTLFCCTNFSIFLDMEEISIEEAIKCMEEQYGWCW